MRIALASEFLVAIVFLTAGCGDDSGDATKTPTTTELPTESVAPRASTAAPATPAPSVTSTSTPSPTRTPRPSGTFILTIPAEITDLDEAIEYVQRTEGQHPDQLLESGDDEITSGVVGIPESIHPKLLVIIRASSREEALQEKIYYADELRKLFDRWSLCHIDIGWSLNTYTGIGEGTQHIDTNEFDDDLLDDYYVTPGCAGPVIAPEARDFLN